MEHFIDRAHVRLRSREDGAYLHADEDGWSVSLSPHRALLNTTWVVHLLQLQHGAATYVLLHGATYGRYLAIWVHQPHPQAPPQLQPEVRTIQRVYDTPLQGDVMWEVRAAEDGSSDVRLRNAMRHTFVLPLWIVEAIPLREFPPDLPQQIPNSVEHPDPVMSQLIRYIRVDNFGIFNLPWRAFLLDGRSVVDLIGELAVILDANFNEITLCARAGFHGRLTPLVIDLPDNEETIDVIVFTTGSPGENYSVSLSTLFSSFLFLFSWGVFS